MFRIRAVRPFRRALVAAALAVLGACSDQKPTEPVAPAAGGSLDGLLSSGPRLVECHSDETLFAGDEITPLGGSISIGGMSVVFPAGAVLGPTRFTLTVPASRYVEIEVKAEDTDDGHFLFELPVVVTIDYSRCNRSDLLTRPVTVWYIDSQTKELLSPMGGIDNKLNRSITFSTNHFSGYAIAF